MEESVSVKYEPVWPPDTKEESSNFDVYKSNAVDNGNILKIESGTSVIQNVEYDTLHSRTNDIMTVENFELASGMIPVKQETKSKLAEPGLKQENTFESSANIKGEISIEEQTVDQLIPCSIEEDNAENVAVSGMPVYSCDSCHKSFKTRSILKRHLLTRTGETPYCCAECGFLFAQQRYLEAHMDAHSEEKAYCCTICRKMFTGKVNLKSHLLSHSTEKPHICIICGTVFTLKSHINAHVVTHSGEKPFVCTICNNTFSAKNLLKNHMLTHSGEQLFKCSTCGYRFSWSSSSK